MIKFKLDKRFSKKDKSNSYNDCSFDQNTLLSKHSKMQNSN